MCDRDEETVITVSLLRDYLRLLLEDAMIYGGLDKQLGDC